MATKKAKLIVDMTAIDGNEYEIAGGGGVPGPSSIGSEEIKNDSVGMEDLTPAVRAAIEAGGTPATDSDIDELFPDDGGEGNKEYADNTDIDELFP
jgi:hypothetical protein